MHKPEISIICPSIRPDNLDAIYDSILSSTKHSFELIVAGPYPLSTKLQGLKNVKYVKDFGSGVRASQIAATMAEGELMVHTADDALFLPNALDENIGLLTSMGNDGKNVVVAKYYEGQNGTEKVLQPDDYFKIKGSTWTASKFISDSYWLFNVAIMHRSWFEELGGWDCSFEGTFYSHVDLAIRAQFAGSNVKMSEFPLLDCDHSQADHSPIEIAQTNFDKPLYFRKYGNPGWVMHPMNINLDNWKDSDTVWSKRFK